MDSRPCDAAPERPSPITASFIASSSTKRLTSKRRASLRSETMCPRCLAASVYRGGSRLSLVGYQQNFSTTLNLEATRFSNSRRHRHHADYGHRYSAGGLISLDERPLLELNEMLHGSSTSTTP